MPKVSIIIPTYNCESFIDKTIQSVINQTYTDWELVIVDDFSKDRTREILKEWQKKDERIHLIFLDKNSGGPAHPKNAAITETNGKYIAYLDHDDEWLPEKLEKQINILENDSKIGLISCEALIIDAEEKIIRRFNIPKVPDSGVFPAILSTDFIFSNSSLIIPKEVIDKIGERDENPKIGVAEDREFELRVANAGYKFYVIHEPLFKYRLHEKNALKGKTTYGFNYIEANLKYLSFYKKYNLEYIVYRTLAKEYFRLGDINNSKKYCKLVLSQKKDPELVLAYILLFFGKYGMIMLRKLLILRSDLMFFLGKKTKLEKEGYRISLSNT
jgi:teichuronic acid biosynthesis glycosyltransferase TuaG